MGSRVLVSGGAGAIGYFLCKRLVERGDMVFLVDNYSRSIRDKHIEQLLQNKNIEEIDIDLCDYSSYEKLPKNIDYIYHLAAINGTQNFYERPYDVLLSCTMPTVGLINHYYSDQNLKRFIYAGSSETYASTVTEFGWEVPTKEDVPLCISDSTNVRWSYGGAKIHGELSTIAAGAQHELPFTVLRYHNVYGPRMGDKHVIPDFLERAKRGVYELYGFEDTRSFIYVEDAVVATIKCAESKSTKGEIVNLGGLPEISMLDLGKKILDAIGVDAEIVCHPSPKGSVRRRAPDLTKLQNLTGFVQKVPLEEGLRETAEYYLPELLN